jgi:hypothetical protein
MFLFQTLLPGDCLLTGYCTAPASPADIPSGLMFLAVGAVCLGVAGLLSSRNRAPR